MTISLEIAHERIEGLRAVSRDHSQRLAKLELWRAGVLGWVAGAAAVGGIVGGLAIEIGKLALGH